MQSKTELRREMKRIRSLLTQEQCEQAGESVRRALVQLPEYIRCEQLFVYVSYGKELPTHPLICQAIAQGKQVAVPKVLPEGRMEFYEIHSLDELQPGTMGILEPITERVCRPESQKQPLMLLPGLAFTKAGGRLGYGGGYYDRYLANCMTQCPSLCRAAIGYDFSLCTEVFEESYDIPVDLILWSGGMHRVDSLQAEPDRETMREGTVDDGCC